MALGALAACVAALACAGDGVAAPPPAPAAPRAVPGDVVVLGGDACHDLGPSVEILHDPTGSWTLADVRSEPQAAAFTSDPTDNLHLGPTTDVYWIRFRVALADEGAAARDWYLTALRPFLASFDIYAPRPACDPTRADCWEHTHYGFWDRDGLDRVLSLRLPLAPGPPVTVYARLQAQWHLLLPLDICAHDAALSRHQGRLLLHGVLLGVLLVMAVVGFVLFAALRDRSFAWFAVFEVAILTHFVADPGLLDEWIGAGAPDRLAAFGGIAIGVSVVASIGFARAFLDTRRRTPLIDRGLLAYMGVTAALTVLVPVLGPVILATVSAVLGWIAPVVIIAPGVLCWRRGFAPARFYLLAWGIYGVATVLTFIRGDWEIWSPEIYLGGSALASLLLCVAIADRLRTMRRERAELDVAKSRVEDALRESEAKYRALFENAQVGIFRVRMSDGAVLEANDAVARMFGFPDGEAFIGADTRGAWVDPSERERMYAEARAGGGHLDRFEALIRRRDGRERWFRFDARLVPERGYMEGVGYDVTEERLAAEHVRQSERRFRALADASRALTLMTDLGLERFLYANPAALSQLGYDAAELKTIAPSELVHPDDRDRFRQVQRAARPDGPAAGLQLRYLTKGGEIRWLDAVGVPVELEEGWVWLVTGLDVTDRRRTENQMMRAEKMAALGVVVAGVAHEINNPNNFIHFNLPILRRYIEAMTPLLDRAAATEPDLELMGLPYDEFLRDMQAMLDDMEHGSARITGIVSQLRSYVRGAESQKVAPVSLDRVVDNVMTLVGKQVRKMVRRLDVAVDDDLPPVTGDAGKLEQALINLVINAGQAADKDDARIRVAVGRSPDDAGRLRVTVADNGAGIPEEVLPRIFDPFFTTKSGDAGTGLGLGIVERIVDEHGGTIAVESTPGAGTTFTIELPAATEAAPPAEGATA